MKSVNGARKRVSAGPVLCPWCRVLVIVTVCSLAIWSMLFSHFVPTPLGEEISLGAALALGAAGAAFGAWGGLFNPERNPNYAQMVARAPIFGNALNRSMALALLGFWFGFLGVEGGLLEWWTVNMGRPGQMLVHVSSYQGQHRTGCAGLNFREAPWLFRRAVCVEYPSTADTPRAHTPVVLRGRASLTGIDISSYEMLPNPGP